MPFCVSNELLKSPIKGNQKPHARQWSHLRVRAFPVSLSGPSSPTTQEPETFLNQLGTEEQNHKEPKRKMLTTSSSTAGASEEKEDAQF